ncbi:MAG: dethiobiotin synthase [Enterobacteriaceae bacterium]
MKKVIFITGTDTNVGKTLISCAILNKIAKGEHKVIGCKPISTGINKNGKNKDVVNLLKFSNLKLKYHQINSFSFKNPTSPNIASFIEKKEVMLNEIIYKIKKLKKISDFLIIEGIGGWKTPINNNQYCYDIIFSKRMSVILVVGIKVGCINHTLLTIDSMINLKKKITGWIANFVDKKMKYKLDYLKTLKKKIDFPCIGIIPYIKNKKIENISKYIKIKSII